MTQLVADPFAPRQRPTSTPPRPPRVYDPADLPPGTVREHIILTASDGVASAGLLHTPPGGSTACVFIMHPRTNQMDHYPIPGLLKGGLAAWGQASRHVNNDTDMTHEEVLLDTAAGMRMLRDRGFTQIIFLGMSGGGSLLGHYQAQAATPPEDREEFTPGGEPTGFRTEVMPTGDLYIAQAAHQGEGRHLLFLLDPAVIDENDPIASDPALDMYNAANGYRPHPEPSHYDLEWLKVYRAAQVDRCRRLDAIARFRIEEGIAARAIADPLRLELPEARRALLAPRPMVIYRTSANPVYADPTLSPNRRPRGEHPIKANYNNGAFARIITPRAWLSTWSGLSSHANLNDNIGRITIPTLINNADGDALIFPEQHQELFELSGAKDKTLTRTEYAGHHMQPTPDMPRDMAPPVVRSSELLVNWIKERLGA